MSYLAEILKTSLATSIGFVVENALPSSPVYLATGPIEKTQRSVKDLFKDLEGDHKNRVYQKVWELAKMQDPRIDGDRWGERHLFDDDERLAKAMHRLGLLSRINLCSFSCLSYAFGEGGLGSQYFSLGGKLGRDPVTGQIGLINGMGMPTLEQAGRDAECFSDKFACGNNIHCVYNATHQKTPSGDMNGYFADVMRMKAIDGGSYSKTSYLAAQQIIDFLVANPERKYLQIGVSEGAAHVNATIRMVHHARPDLLSRIRVLTLCPAYFILQEQYEGIQVLNFFKKEDGIPTTYATHAHKIGHSKDIVVVPHRRTQDNPHNQLSDDFRDVVKPYIDEFMRSGNIY